MCKKLLDSSFNIQENRLNKTIAHVNISSLLFEICHTNNLDCILNKLTCYKNPKNPSSTETILTNK